MESETPRRGLPQDRVNVLTHHRGMRRTVTSCLGPDRSLAQPASAPQNSIMPSAPDSRGYEPETPSADYRNVHGRRWGRGARPYLIVLKLVSVATFVGGLVTVLAAVLLGPAPAGIDQWREQAELVSRMYVRAIVPGQLLATLLGVVLAASLRGVIFRMRWFQVKLGGIAVAIPGLHLYMRGQSRALRALLGQASPDLASAAVLRGHLLAGTLVALGIGILILTLGRTKPRLGQDYGRTFARVTGTTTS
jgi:hypothetical protein